MKHAARVFQAKTFAITRVFQVKTFAITLQATPVTAIALLALVLVPTAPALAGSDAAWRRGALDPSPSQRVVDEREWAARLVEALDLGSVLDRDHDADDVFGLLCPEGVERRVQADGRRVPTRRPFALKVDATRSSNPDGMRMVVDVPATALYALRVTGRGAAHWAVDRRDLGSVDPTPLGTDLASSLLALRAGPHEIEARTPSGSRVEGLELAAFRPLCIAPADGWGRSRPLTFGSKARTMIRAFGLEGRLPAAGPPRVIEGENYDAADPAAGRTNRELEQPASDGSWATARNGPADLAWKIDLAKPGLFSLVVRIHGEHAQLWTVDDRYTLRVSPPQEAAGFGWTEVVTLPLDGGEHVLRARVAEGGGIDVLHLVERRTRDEDYLDLLESLGFREGAPGERVSVSAAEGNLGHPSFRTFTSNLLLRGAGMPGDGIVLVTEELDRLYQRPLSPVLPADVPR